MSAFGLSDLLSGPLLFLIILILCISWFDFCFGWCWWIPVFSCIHLQLLSKHKWYQDSLLSTGFPLASQPSLKQMPLLCWMINCFVRTHLLLHDQPLLLLLKSEKLVKTNLCSHDHHTAFPLIKCLYEVKSWNQWSVWNAVFRAMLLC